VLKKRRFFALFNKKRKEVAMEEPENIEGQRAVRKGENTVKLKNATF